MVSFKPLYNCCAASLGGLFSVLEDLKDTGHRTPDTGHRTPTNRLGSVASSTQRSFLFKPAVITIDRKLRLNCSENEPNINYQCTPVDGKLRATRPTKSTRELTSTSQ